MSQQDFISLGLDVSQFSDAKKKRLQDFISIFEKLSKYDGLKITPVMQNEGLVKFNRTLAETRSVLDDINASIKNLNSTNIKLNTSSSVQSIRSVTAAQKETTEAIDKSTSSVNKMGIEFGKLGKGLTQGLSLLRSIAYVLPGIGIAGIFNLAGEAIVEAVQALGFFNSEEEKLAKLSTDSNKSLTEQITLYRELIKLQSEFREENSSQNILGRVYTDKEQSLLRNKLDEDIAKARGYSQDTQLPDEIKNAEKRLAASKIDIGVKQFAGMAYPISENDAVSNLIKQKSGQIETIKKQAEELKYYEHILNTPIDNLTFSERAEWNKLGESGTKSKIDESKSIIDVAKNQIGYISDKLKEYYDSKQDLALKNAQYEKFLSDEDRKRFVSRLKEESSVLSDESKLKLQDDRNFHDERLRAIKQEYDAAEELNNSNRINVTGTSAKYGDKIENPNVSATKVDIENALNVQSVQNKIALNLRNKQIEDNNIEFYQRRLKALTEIDKLEIDKETVKNEKIASNEEHSMSERLDAYSKYLLGKQLINDRDYALSIQRGSDGTSRNFVGKDGKISFSNGKNASTSLIPEEQTEIDKKRLTEQYDLQSDAEKKVYEIVYSSLKKELDTVLNFNHQVDDANKAAYAKELRENNERFKNKIFSYKSFKENYDAINKKYGVILTSKQEEARDEKDVKTARNELDSLKGRRIDADKKVQTTKDQLDLSTQAHKDGNASDNELLIATQNYDKAIGNRNAYDKAIEDADKKVKEAEKTGNEDKIKNAKAVYEQLQQLRKEESDNEKKIVTELFNFIKTAIDGESKHRLEVLALQEKTQDEGYESEINAIDKSSLSAKDKAALDIQLNEQKLEYDKTAAIEERKIKTEQAIHDRELAIAEITWNIEQGISEALTFPPPFDATIAAERAILGGIAIATVLATPLPSYELGTQGVPHAGGYARTGEKGKPELVYEPYKSPYWITKDNISWLPEGTEVVPFKEAVLEGHVSAEDNMMPFRWLARQLKKNTPQVNTTNIIKVDLGKEQYKRRILGN